MRRVYEESEKVRRYFVLAIDHSHTSGRTESTASHQKQLRENGL